MRTVSIVVLLLASLVTAAQDAPRGKAGRFAIKDFQFTSGEALPEVTIHYRTLGSPRTDAAGKVTNAILILHGTTGSGANFHNPTFAEELFRSDQPFDLSKYYVILPDGIGHGDSTRPSSGLRAKFPRYGYRDMIAAQHRLLTEGLGVNHLRLVLGTSMGGMHTWLWGQTYPDFMEALLPLASLPTQIAGRNRMWRKSISDAIRNDPAWMDGNYTNQPPSLRSAISIMTLMSDNPVNWQAKAPTLAAADKAFDAAVAARLNRSDANDVLYAVEASHDYDPGPGLEKIKAPLLAINFADDLINPPELGILEREIQRVPNGKAVLIPSGTETVGHGTHTKAKVWKHLLIQFMKQTEQ